MKSVDTSKWKHFKLCDLFDKLDLKCKKKDFKKALDISTEKNDEFSLPLVNAKHSNNGIMYYGRKADFDYAEMTLDVVADGAASTGDVYPQPQETGVLYNAYLIKPKTDGISEHVLCFLATVVQKCIKHKYGYDNKAGWSKVKNETIYLPANNDGHPDWNFMETYMNEIRIICDSRKYDLNRLLVTTHKKLIVSGWKNFKLCDLFDKLELKCKKEDFNKSFDTSIEKTDEFSLPLVNAKHSNNGIMYYGRKTDFDYAEMSLDIVSNGAASTGDVYPQPHKTGVLYDAYLIKPKPNSLSAPVLCFLAALVQRCIKHKYGYDDKAVWSKVKNEQISLPVNESGEPDWEYMETYMREIESQCNEKLDTLMSIM